MALVEGGVDFLEIGVPFSDPLADGIANQLGAQRALAAGTTLPKLLEIIRTIRRQTETPIILYTYLNPAFQYGLSRFEVDAADAGVDGVLFLDLPPDEHLAEDNGPHRLHRIRLVAPTTDESRIEKLTQSASGFIYYVSREGVTGEQQTVSESIGTKVAAIKAHTSLPVAVGFGISNAEQARIVAKVADAVVVGSAIVRRIGEYGDSPDLAKKITAFIKPLTEAVHGVS
jgi:tryptophan synthase alpha chain